METILIVLVVLFLLGGGAGVIRGGGGNASSWRSTETSTKAVVCAKLIIRVGARSGVLDKPTPQSPHPIL